MNLPDPKALFTTDEHIRAAQQLHESLTGNPRDPRRDTDGAAPRLGIPESRPLSEPDLGDVPFWDVVTGRTSTYECAKEGPSPAQIAALLHAYGRAPSARGLRSTRLLLVNTRDENGDALWAPEVFRWDPARPEELTGHGTLTPETLASTLAQRDLATTFPWIIFMSADLRALVARGGFASYRMAYADAGVIGATLHLTAEAVGLAGRIIGSVDPQRVHEVMGLSTDELVSMAFVVGRKATHTR